MSNDNNWGADNAQNNNAGNNNANNSPARGAVNSLLGLLSETSMMGSQRSVPEINEVMKSLDDHLEALGKGTLTDVQRMILPQVTALTNAISSQLPGICLHIVVQGVVFVQPVFFSNKSLNNTLEDININVGQNQRMVSMPMPPLSYVRNEVIKNIREHYKSVGVNKGAREVIISNLLVIDLEQYRTEEANNTGLTNTIRESIMRAWEEGMKIAVTKQAIMNGITTLPSPFASRGNAYGSQNSAVARVEPVIYNVRDGIPSAANLSVRLQTSNNNGGYNNSQETAKELVTGFATVTLTGQPLANFRPAANQQQFSYMPQNNGRPAGYFPLIPVISYCYARPGEQMGDNSDLASFFLGLFAVLAANNNYLFTEALRGKTIGARGSLVNTETIITNVERGNQIPRQKEAKLTDQKLGDLDYVNNWIKQNIAPHSILAIDIAQFGPNAAVNNFVSGLLSSSKDYQQNVMTVVSTIDSMSKGALSTVISENRASGKGWTPSKPMLHQSGIILPIGTFEHEGRTHSLGEVDEIFLARMFPGDTVMVNNWMSATHGDQNQTPVKAREYNIRSYLNQFFSAQVALNGFGTRYYWDPEFMRALVQALGTLGQLQATGTMGTFRGDMLNYGPNMNYITNAAAGSTGGFVAPGGATVGNGSALVFGMGQ